MELVVLSPPSTKNKDLIKIMVASLGRWAVRCYDSSDIVYLKDRDETAFIYELRGYPEHPSSGERVLIDGVAYTVKSFRTTQRWITPIPGQPPTLGCIHVDGDVRNQRVGSS